MSRSVLAKAQFLQRLVHWIGGSTPSGRHAINGEKNVQLTAMNNGRVARVTSGAVKMSQVPNAKKGKLRKEVTYLSADEAKRVKDTDTAKYTMMNDGRVARVQFFVKSLAALHARLGALGKAIDYDALEDEHEPRPKKAGKGGKGSPVGSRTDQARHQTSAFHATKKRLAELKPADVADKEWETGVKHEGEHQGSVPGGKIMHAKIAADHLAEDPHYYSKLKRAGID